MRNKKPNFYEVPYQPQKARFKFRTIGLGLVEHNYLCAVCHDRPAVFNCDSGILQPCWTCQPSFRVVKMNWFTKLFTKEPDREL